MNSIILLYICFPCAIALTLLWAVAKLNELGCNPLGELFDRYRRLPRLAQFLLPALVALQIVHGSTKMPTNNVPPGGSSPTNVPPAGLLGQLSPSLASTFNSGFSADEIAAGYALWRVGTNETWNFDLMPEARIVEAWRMRGAAEDWAVCATTNLGPVAMTTDGRLVTTNGVFAPSAGQLAIVPEVNWPLLGANAPSRAWWAETPWASTVFTWQNAFLGRDTNVPVSVQAEFTRDGDFIFRYDFTALGTNLTSELYYRLRPEDLAEDDRDEDGLSTWDEVCLYHSNPGLVDSDGDGLLDYEEVMSGSDPAVRSVPNAEIVARVTGSATNETYQWARQPDSACPLTTLKLWDGFAADWPAGMTNLVYERTLDLGVANGWQHYFLSSKETAAGDWDLRGLVLEWDDGCGNRGTALASPYGDSFPLPVASSTVTIRLWAISPKIACLKPMYLIGYAPIVTVSGGTEVRDADGNLRAYYLSAGDGNMALSVAIDRSHRPCKALPRAEELALPGLTNIAETCGAMAFSGNENGGTIAISCPGCYQLPKFGIDNPHTPDPPLRRTASRGGASGDEGGVWVVCLDPSIEFGGVHRFVSTGLVYDEANGGYCVERYFPLDSKCLWAGWQKTENGYWQCSCVPEVKAGGDADGLPFVEKSCAINGDQTAATGRIRVFGQEVWSGTAAHSWRDMGSGGGASSGETLLSKGDECDDCSGNCEDGDCDTASGPGLNSVKFRLSLGMPRQGQHSGFVYFESEGPVLVTRDVLQLMTRGDANVADQTNGTSRIVTCYDRNGRQISVAPMADGIRLTVRVYATGELEDVWDVFNEGGDTNVVRIVQRSRLDNVMSDETYACDSDGAWSKTDNISGIVETLARDNRLNDPLDGKLYETRTTYDADGNQLNRVSTESSRIGAFGSAVLRETYWEQDTGVQVKWRAATYWNDAAHRDRHGQLKLLSGNCVAWAYHDYDARGFETLRVEQRNGSPVPTAFPEVVAGELYGIGGLADAFVTVFDYTPFDGDDGCPDDLDKVRSETRYVVRNGQATVIARTWTRYTRLLYGGFGCYDMVKTETWRAASASALRTDSANAYSYTISYSDGDGFAPLVVRGEIAAELDEDGVLVENDVDEYDFSVYATKRKSNAQTYEVVERDAHFGNELCRATYLVGSGELIDEEVSTYDAKNRLRATRYLDGTSETNAWSCCRKLWSRDREGRTTLRSAVTGRDRLYYAEEEVWLRELSTNGAHRVTQHFFDGLGRETATVVFAGSAPGAYTVPDAPRVAGTETTATTDYPLGGDDMRITIDARGTMTTLERQSFADRDTRVESTYSSTNAAVPVLTTQTTQVRNGARVTEKTWDDKWTRETVVEDYTVDGCAVRYEVAESSDCGTVTNRIVTCDFLGRTVQEATPHGTTATTYHGATEKADVTTLTAGSVTRVSTAIYDARGEIVGSVQDGVTNRTDETYEMDLDGSWWKVTRRETSDATTVDSLSESREQLTGRMPGVVRRQIDIDVDGVAEETVERVGAADGERATSVSNAVSGAWTRTTRFGVVREVATADETRQFAVDAFGRQVAEARRVDGAQGPRVLPWSETGYNVFGDVVARTSYTNGTALVAETFAYDGHGRRVSAVDALGHEVETLYDAVGNVVEQRGATWPVRYGYDTAGRRVSLSTTKDGRIWDVTRWTYDPATGACLTKRYPDGSQVVYSVTPDGLPSETAKASGARSQNVYDASRRLVGTISSDGAGDAAFAYDAFGKMTAASNGVAQYAYARHRGGIVTNETVQAGGGAHLLVRTVDGFGRLAGRGVFGQEAQAISYDDRGRVAAVSNGEVVVAYVYGEDGTDAGYVLSVSGGTTVERRVVRDVYRPEQVVAVSNSVNGALFAAATYARDALGRVAEREDAGCGTWAAFAYDAIGQVVEAVSRPLSSTNCSFASYAYDQIGNIAGSAALSYTTDGEVTGFGGMTFGYDSASRLTTVATGGVTIATYAYDAFDRRVRKTTAEATTTYFYDGWNLVREEIAEAGFVTDVIEYFWGKDIAGSLDTAGGIGALLYLKRNGMIYVPLYDAGGNIVGYVDVAGGTAARFAYDAFGNEVQLDGVANDPLVSRWLRFRYSTKYCDAETGLYYYGYRYYAPTQARWLTRDPLGEQGGLNLHVFCANDGVNKVDWLGLIADPSQANDARRFWRLIARRLREELHYECAADMLEHSLDERVGNTRFGRGSRLSNAIKKSTEYDSEVELLMDSYPAGWRGSVDRSSKLDYGRGDLSSAVNKSLNDSTDTASVKFTGNGCKSRNGEKYRFKLDVKVSSTYKYGAWRYDDLTLSEGEKENMVRQAKLG